MSDLSRVLVLTLMVDIFLGKVSEIMFTMECYSVQTRKGQNFVNGVLQCSSVACHMMEHMLHF
ncbi:hypothetical protein AGATL06_19880 [Agathobaculum sp. TL06]